MVDETWFKLQGKFIQRMRKRQFPGDTQTRFAARIGVGVTTIRNLEAGKGGVAWETVVKVLSMLGIKTFYLLYLKLFSFINLSI